MVEKFRGLFLLYTTYNRHVDFWLFLDFSSEDSSKRPTLESNKQISTEVWRGPYFLFILYTSYQFCKKSVLWYAALEKKFFKYIRKRNILKKKLSKKSLYIFHIALPKTQKQNHSPVWSSYLFAQYLCIIFNFFAPHCGPKI